MARELRQSTSTDVPIGPFLDATDGVTAMTGLTITQPDVRLKKNGGAWAQKAAAQTLTHEENGFYEVTLDTTDTNTLGLLRLAVFEATAAPVWEDFLVLTQGEWDAKYATAVRPTAAQIADAVWDEDATAHQTDGTFGLALGDSGGDQSILAYVGQISNDIAGLGDNTAAAVWEYDLVSNPPPADSAGEYLTTVPAAVLAANFEQDGEAGVTVAQGLRVTTAALAGKLSGAGTGTEVVRSVLDAKTRITYSVDDDGNRSAVTTDLT